MVRKNRLQQLKKSEVKKRYFTVWPSKVLKKNKIYIKPCIETKFGEESPLPEDFHEDLLQLQDLLGDVFSDCTCRDLTEDNPFEMGPQIDQEISAVTPKLKENISAPIISRTSSSIASNITESAPMKSEKQKISSPKSEKPKIRNPPTCCDLYCGPNMMERGINITDPCDPDKGFPQPRVIIVGAGMAGLSCAARLTQKGITNFLVLEAYERPGGRIKSVWMGDVVAELGSNWRPDDCSQHPVFKLKGIEEPPLPGVPAVHNMRGLFNRATAGKMQYSPAVNAYFKFRQIEQEAAAIYCLGGSKQHGSLLNFISIRIQQELHEFPEEQQHDAARIMFGLSHILSARSNDDTSLLAYDNTGCFMNIPGGEVRVPLGLSGVLAPILRQIPEGLICYCKPVNCIYWGTTLKSGYRAIVSTCDGQEFPCDYVIVTVSLGVLCQNSAKMFCPALPAAKVDASRMLGFGYCNKVYFEFCRPFWFWQTTNLDFQFCPGVMNSRCDWTRGITAIEKVPYSKRVMCAWVVGQEAIMMEGLCDKDVAEGITCLLRSITGVCIPYPSTILRSSWASDPCFLGSYSYNCSCCTGAHEELACPLPGPSEPVPPILLFAGEATVPGHCATVDGARISGIREAERVVQLTIRYRGPPVLESACENYCPCACQC